MSRRQKWTPYSVAGLRDSLARGLDREIVRAESDLDKARCVGQDWATAEFASYVDEFRESAEGARNAELFWVSSDMATVALDASHDMPGVIGQDLHWPTGLMLFETPLPEQTTAGLADTHRSLGVPDRHAEAVPVDGLMWHPTDLGVRIGILVRAERIPEELRHPGAALVNFAAADLPLPADFTDGASFLDGAAAAPAERDVGVVAFLAAAWHLMAMPAVARARDVQPRTGESRAADTVTVPAGQVRIVDARPMRSVPTDPDESGDEQGDGRHYSSRWVVRGHWRQQAHGPGRAQRRTQWIESYIKGPEDAPLAPHTLVRAWRR